MRRRRNPEIIAGRVNADGTVAAGDGFFSQRTQTGVYVVTFVPGFRLISMDPQLISQGNAYFAHSYAYTERSVGVAIFTVTPTLIDWGFSFIAVGAQS